MDQEELEHRIEQHVLWLESAEMEGVRFNLIGDSQGRAVFKGADLRKAKLCRADLKEADFRSANLIAANLSEANLSEADLRNADLSGANLRNSNLTKAKLNKTEGPGGANGANLSGADLSGADLSSANLDGANLSGAALNVAKLFEADLSSANLFWAILSGADLNGADLSSANLSHANLSGANLSGANLSGADLSGANLSGANLSGVDFSGSDLRHARGIKFDLSRLTNVKLSHNANDPWSVLRRNYTGTRLFFNLILLILFFIPYIAHTMMWVGVNRAQEYIISAENRLSERINKLPIDAPDKKLIIDELKHKADNYALCLSGDCREYKVYELLISRDKEAMYWVTAVLLIIYNIIRTYLTREVSILSDEELRSGYTPPLGTYKPWSEGYIKYMPLHYVVQVLFYLSIITFAIHAKKWLLLPVFLPASGG